MLEAVRNALDALRKQCIYAAGSHTVLVLLESGCRVTIIDNMDNAFPEAYRRMQDLAGDKASRMQFIQVILIFVAAYTVRRSSTLDCLCGAGRSQKV